MEKTPPRVVEGVGQEPEENILEERNLSHLLPPSVPLLYTYNQRTWCKHRGQKT